MSLMDDLLAEKTKKVMGNLKPVQPLVEPKNITVLMENPTNELVKGVLDSVGGRPDSSSSFTSYSGNIRNKKIATILSKFGKVEI